MLEVKIEAKITGYIKQKHYTVLSFVPHGPMVKASGYDFVSTSRLEPEDSRFDSWWGSLRFFHIFLYTTKMLYSNTLLQRISTSTIYI